MIFSKNLVMSTVAGKTQISDKEKGDKTVFTGLSTLLKRVARWRRPTLSLPLEPPAGFSEAEQDEIDQAVPRIALELDQMIWFDAGGSGKGRRLVSGQSYDGDEVVRPFGPGEPINGADIDMLATSLDPENDPESPHQYWGRMRPNRFPQEAIIHIDNCQLKLSGGPKDKNILSVMRLVATIMIRAADRAGFEVGLVTGSAEDRFPVFFSVGTKIEEILPHVENLVRTPRSDQLKACQELIETDAGFVKLLVVISDFWDTSWNELIKECSQVTNVVCIDLKSQLCFGLESLPDRVVVDHGDRAINLKTSQASTAFVAEVTKRTGKLEAALGGEHRSKRIEIRLDQPASSQLVDSLGG